MRNKPNRNELSFFTNPEILIRDKIYLLGIILLVVGLSFSRAFTSISYVIIISAWLFDKNILRKFGEFFRNKSAWILASIYFLHLLGLVYTSDFSYAWLDIRTKIPLLILPLVFSTMPKISKREFLFILLVFSFMVVSSMSTALYWFFKDSLIDFRDAFRFVSHIRLGIMSVIACSILLWMAVKKSLGFPLYARIIFILLFIYLIWAVFILEIMSGMLIFVFTTLGMLIWFIFNTLKFNKLKLILGFAILVIASGFYLGTIISNYSQVKKPHDGKRVTARGNIYENEEAIFPIENGNYVGRQICWKEMKQAWNQRSEIAFDSLDNHNNILRYTLLRYLNSKHLSKDYEGIYQLSQADISYVEQGYANVEYTRRFSLKKRIYKVLWEYSIYKMEGKVKESSGMKRLFLWKTGLRLLERNPVFGVGTGDVRNEFREQLRNDNSPLFNAHLRAHNQFITIAIAFGTIGFIYFMFALFYPFIHKKNYDFLFMGFFISYFLSMLWEDSLETQIGVTIFAFFYPFYLFQNPYSNHE